MLSMMNCSKAHIIILGLLMGLLIGGCAGSQTVVEKPAEELVDEGIHHFDKGDYKKAIDSFEQLKDWYPFSKYAILAELKIADAHFHLGQYPDAVFAYEEFEKLHPRNEAIPYVIYQVGMSHYLQVDTVDRDQSSAQKAVAAFDRLIRQYPRDSYAHLAQGYVDKCNQSMSGHEFYVGIYYYRIKKYRSALGRFKKVIKDYPDVGIHTKALSYIKNCETLLKKQAETGKKEDELYFMPE
jgi:outer membrane protein assembly factor BamD